MKAEISGVEFLMQSGQVDLTGFISVYGLLLYICLNLSQRPERYRCKPGQGV